MTATTYFVFTKGGTPLGTIAAHDANQAQGQAQALHGWDAYILPASHTSEAERFSATLAQQRADQQGARDT